jgi:hypothetical protein
VHFSVPVDRSCAAGYSAWSVTACATWRRISKAAGAADVASCGELSAVRVPLSVELSERMAHHHFRQLPRGLRQPRQPRADVTNLLLFLEAAVLCDDRIFADYAVWLRDCVTARGARDQLVAAMLSTLHERLAIGVPSVDLPLHAASLALA